MGNINEHFEVVHDVHYNGKWYAAWQDTPNLYLRSDGTVQDSCMPNGWFDSLEDVEKAFKLWQRKQDLANASAYRLSELAWEQSTAELNEAWDDCKNDLADIVGGLLENLTDAQLEVVFGEKMANQMRGWDKAGQAFLFFDQSVHAKH